MFVYKWLSDVCYLINFFMNGMGSHSNVSLSNSPSVSTSLQAEILPCCLGPVVEVCVLLPYK